MNLDRAKLKGDPRVCELHFTEADYKPGWPAMKKLIPGAVPSLHPVPPSSPEKDAEMEDTASVAEEHRELIWHNWRKGVRLPLALDGPPKSQHALPSLV